LDSLIVIEAETLAEIDPHIFNKDLRIYLIDDRGAVLLPSDQRDEL